MEGDVHVSYKIDFFMFANRFCVYRNQAYITARVYPSCAHNVQAFKEERFYPGYVWITPGWYQQGWWKADEVYLRSLNCTTSDIEQQLNRSLVLLAHPNYTVRKALGQVHGTVTVCACKIILNLSYVNERFTHSVTTLTCSDHVDYRGCDRFHNK